MFSIAGFLKSPFYNADKVPPAKVAKLGLATLLDPAYKGNRLANYMITLRKEILRLCRACGLTHPSLVTAAQFDLLNAGPEAQAFQPLSAAQIASIGMLPLRSGVTNTQFSILFFVKSVVPTISTSAAVPDILKSVVRNTPLLISMLDCNFV